MTRTTLLTRLQALRTEHERTQQQILTVEHQQQALAQQRAQLLQTLLQQQGALANMQELLASEPDDTAEAALLDTLSSNGTHGQDTTEPHLSGTV